MSTLNDRDSFDTEAGLLMGLISGALDAIDEERAHQFGIDQRVLNDVHELSIVPLLDYMMGYASLQHSNPYGPWDHRGEARRRQDEWWVSFLKEKDALSNYSQVIRIFEDKMTHFGSHGRAEEQRSAQIVIWLTRKGDLLVWMSFGWRKDSHQVLECFSSTKELCEFVATTAEDYVFTQTPGYGGPKKPSFLQLRLAQSLVKLLEDVSERRSEINAGFDAAIERAVICQARIMPGENRFFLRP